jgi:hypothetical protein
MITKKFWAVEFNFRGVAAYNNQPDVGGRMLFGVSKPESWNVTPEGPMLFGTLEDAEALVAVLLEDANKDVQAKVIEVVLTIPS